MTLQTYGTFGFLNPGQLAEEPLMLLDFGIEKGSPRSTIFIMTTAIMTAFCFSIPFRGRGFLRRRRAAAGFPPAPPFSPVSRKKAGTICLRENRKTGGNICMYIFRARQQFLFSGK